jgi:hypothetical protein
MSHGPGQIERRIIDLFAATRDHALSITDITDHAFVLEGKPATRAQRLSATRAAHRLLRRVRDAVTKSDKLVRQAHENTKAALGREQDHCDGIDREYETRLKADPAWRAREKLWAFADHIGVWSRVVRAEQRGYFRIEHDHWCTTETKNGRLYFHPPDLPVRVWAISLERAGVIWADAEVVKVTERNVMTRYAGELARLDRGKLSRWWACWRDVIFVSSRTGRIALALDELWQERYGHATGGLPPLMQMPFAEAIALLGMAPDYTREDVIVAFRRGMMKAHPDKGGTAEQFCRLVEARDRLLAALGTSAPAPRMLTYYPSGMKIVYRSWRGSKQRLAHTRRLGHPRRLTG